MPSVLLVGSKIRRRSLAALVVDMPMTSRRPSSTTPQGGDVVRRVASLGQLQEKPERHRAGPQPSFKLLAEEVRAALAGFVRGKKGLVCLRHKATAAESARTIRGGEAEGARMVDRPQTAIGRSRRGRSGQRPGPVALN
jgi:hypothetical protein